LGWQTCKSWPESFWLPADRDFATDLAGFVTNGYIRVVDSARGLALRPEHPLRSPQAPAADDTAPPVLSGFNFKVAGSRALNGTELPVFVAACGGKLGGGRAAGASPPPPAARRADDSLL